MRSLLFGASLILISVPVFASDDDAPTSELGVRYELESIVITGNSRTSERVVRRYIAVEAGKELRVDNPELDETRYRLMGTGYFSEVELSLKKGSAPGRVILVVAVTERNTFVINDFALGIAGDSTAAGGSKPTTAYGGAAFAETNFWGSGISVGGAFAVADKQTAYRIQVIDPSFLGSKWILGGSFLFNDARDFMGNYDVHYVDSTGTEVTSNYAPIAYTRTGFELSGGYDLTSSVRLRGYYHLESLAATIPIAASEQRGLDIVPIDFYMRNGKSMLSYLGVSVEVDTRNDPVLPTKGERIATQAELGALAIGSDYSFLRMMASASWWWPVQVGHHQHVLRLDAFGGAIVGEAPLFMNFYIGDFSNFLPDRFLDLNFDHRPSPNFLRTDIAEMRYETFAFRLMGEWRIPLYHGERSIYGIDFFVSGGIFGLGSGADFRTPPSGYTGFGRIPVDLTFNVGVQISTKVGGFVLGLSNLIGYLPIHSEVHN